MKTVAVIGLCLLASSQAFFISDVASVFNTVKDGVVHAAETVKDGVVHAAETVKDGVVSAANTVADGVKDAAHAVASGVSSAVDAVSHVDLSGVGAVLGQVWDVAKGPLGELGKEAATAAANYALSEGLSALATAVLGKRDLPMADVQNFINQELRDEYNQWYAEIQRQVLSSARELQEAVSSRSFEKLPERMRTWISQYTKALADGNLTKFIEDNAQEVTQKALQSKSLSLSICDEVNITNVSYALCSYHLCHTEQFQAFMTY